MSKCFSDNTKWKESTHIYTHMSMWKNEDMTKCCHLSSLGDIGNTVFSLYFPTFRFLKMRTYKFKINTNKLFWSEHLIILNIVFFLYLLCQFKCYIFYTICQLKSFKKETNTPAIHISSSTHKKRKKGVSLHWGHSFNFLIPWM